MQWVKAWQLARLPPPTVPKPIEDLGEAPCRKRQAAVSPAIVDAQLVAFQCTSAREDDVTHVSDPLVQRFGPEDPFVRAADDFGRVIKIEKSKTQPVDAAACSFAHTMVDQEPALISLQGWRREADLVSVPPGALARPKQNAVTAPVLEVWRKGNPNVRARSRVARYRPMEQGVTPIKLRSEESGILILRREYGAHVFEFFEVLCQCKRHQRCEVRVSRVGDGPFAEVFDEGDASIFDAPGLLGVFVPFAEKSRLLVDVPVGNATYAR